eukprot:904512-Pleurochrysis_carterae.AAC.1
MTEGQHMKMAGKTLANWENKSSRTRQSNVRIAKAEANIKLRTVTAKHLRPRTGDEQNAEREKSSEKCAQKATTRRVETMRRI